MCVCCYYSADRKTKTHFQSHSDTIETLSILFYFTLFNSKKIVIFQGFPVTNQFHSVDCCCLKMLLRFFFFSSTIIINSWFNGVFQSSVGIFRSIHKRYKSKKLLYSGRSPHITLFRHSHIAIYVLSDKIRKCNKNKFNFLLLK
jgi:hypothetical protein